MLPDCPVHLTEPDDDYEAITWFYDVHCPEDNKALRDEVKRLMAKGEAIELYVINTRGTGRLTRTAVDHETRKEGVFAAIYRSK